MRQSSASAFAPARTPLLARTARYVARFLRSKPQRFKLARLSRSAGNETAGGNEPLELIRGDPDAQAVGASLAVRAQPGDPIDDRLAAAGATNPLPSLNEAPAVLYYAT